MRVADLILDTISSCCGVRRALQETLKKDEGQDKGSKGFVVVDYGFVIIDNGFVTIDYEFIIIDYCTVSLKMITDALQ